MSAASLHERLATLPVPLDESTEREVQDLLWNFVDDHKAAGWPPERVIITVKSIVRNSGLTKSVIIGGIGGTYVTGEQFLTEMIRLSIRRYFLIE